MFFSLKLNESFPISENKNENMIRTHFEKCVDRKNMFSYIKHIFLHGTLDY